MARYYYIVSGASPALWIDDEGNFDILDRDDGPTHYNAFTGLKAAQDSQKICLLKSGYECVIYKFEGKAPYKYLGVVA